MGLGEGGRKRAAALWYLVGSPSHKNLREVLERLLGRVHARLKEHYDAMAGPIRARSTRRRTKNEHMASQVARVRREARYEEVVRLYQQGTPILRIADDLHMSRTTVRKFVAAGAFPERAALLRSKSILDPYVAYLKQRLDESPTNASQLRRAIRGQEFYGGHQVDSQEVQGQR